MQLPRCVRINADDARSAAALADGGWREIEILETWQHRVPWYVESPPHIDMATKADLDRCIEIGAVAFWAGRLHSDPMVLKHDAAEARAEWIRAAFGSDQGAILVCRDKGADPPHGFIILRCDPVDGRTRVDLIAVHPDHQRRG